MSTEFGSQYPTLQSPVISPTLKEHVHRSNFEINAGSLSQKEIEIAYKIADCARKIAPAVCSLPENQGKSGFVVVFTKRKLGFPNLTMQIGTVTDPDEVYIPGGKLEKYCIFAAEKARVLKDYPEFISSSQNLTLPEDKRLRSPANQEIPAGALAFGDLIISVSAFKNAKMDAAVSLALATGARLVSFDRAEQLAHDPRVSCNKEYMTDIEDILEKEVLH